MANLRKTLEQHGDVLIPPLNDFAPQIQVAIAEELGQLRRISVDPNTLPEVRIIMPGRVISPVPKDQQLEIICQDIPPFGTEIVAVNIEADALVDMASQLKHDPSVQKYCKKKNLFDLAKAANLLTQAGILMIADSTLTQQNLTQIEKDLVISKGVKRASLRATADLK